MLRVNDEATLRCNLCGHEELALSIEISKPDRFEAHVIYKNGIRFAPRRWLRCKRCDVAMQVVPCTMRAGLEAIADNYYQVDFGNIDLRVRQQKILSLPAEESDNAIRVARVLAIIENYRSAWIKPDSRLRALDFGAGLGVFPIVFSRAAREMAIDLDMHLVETDTRALALLREIPGITLHEGIYDQNIHEGYNIIFMNKVLEHLSDPVDWVSSLKRALVPSGLIYVEVPSTRCLEIDRASNELGSLHFNLFSTKAIEYLANLTSLVLLTCEEVNDPSGKLTCYAAFTNTV
jgi:2-polyprenyl-3-methyl-5-hydroxy-6-metoxy-1,4-benzoquinol methylase